MRLSVVIPTYNRPEELRLCLDGFAHQTASPDAFELVIVDDGSTTDTAAVVEPFRSWLNIRLIRTPNSGCAAARNVAIENAAAGLLLLYDDDLRPSPGAVEACLTFHQRFPEPENAHLLYFQPDPALADCAALQWAFPLLYSFPKTPGIYGWHLFWGGTLTCKKSLFTQQQFNPDFRSLEDMDLALRLARHFDLKVHFDAAVQGTMTRPMTFADIYARQHLLGRFVYLLMRTHAGQLGKPRPPYDRPEHHLIADHAELQNLLDKANEPGADPQLWNRLELHARVSGWIAARDGNISPIVLSSEVSPYGPSGTHCDGNTLATRSGQRA